MKRLRLALLLLAAATVAHAQTVVPNGGCSTAVAINAKVNSCSDSSPNNPGDAYIVVARVYDNHTVTLDCGGCGGILTTLPGYPFSSPTGYQYWMWTVTNPTVGTSPWKFSVTDSGTPSTSLMNVVRISGGVAIIDTLAPPLNTQATTMSNSLTTAAANEPLIGWCVLDHGDTLGPGGSLSALPTNAANSLIIYGNAATAGKNNVACLQPYATDNGVISALALVPAVASPPTFTLAISGNAIPVKLMLPPTGVNGFPCATVAGIDNLKDNIYINFCIGKWSALPQQGAMGTNVVATGTPNVTLTFSGPTLSTPQVLTLGGSSPTGTFNIPDNSGYQFYVNASLLTH